MSEHEKIKIASAQMIEQCAYLWAGVVDEIAMIGNSDETDLIVLADTEHEIAEQVASRY